MFTIYDTRWRYHQYQALKDDLNYVDKVITYEKTVNILII